LSQTSQNIWIVSLLKFSDNATVNVKLEGPRLGQGEIVFSSVK
jgi:hypothetical protein